MLILSLFFFFFSQTVLLFIAFPQHFIYVFWTTNLLYPLFSAILIR